MSRVEYPRCIRCDIRFDMPAEHGGYCYEHSAVVIDELGTALRAKNKELREVKTNSEERETICASLEVDLHETRSAMSAITGMPYDSCVIELTQALRLAHTWRPIAAAPRDGTRVLLCDTRWPDGSMDVGSWSGQWLAGDGAMAPTHWLPLPEPPGCRCHQEIGDSPCPVHGTEEE